MGPQVSGKTRRKRIIFYEGGKSHEKAQKRQDVWGFLSYFILNGDNSFFVELLKLPAMLAIPGLLFLAALVGFYAIDYVCDKTRGEIGKAYPVLLMINAVCFVIPFVMASIVYHGKIGYNLRDASEALYNGLYNFTTSIYVQDKFSMRPLVLICDAMLVYSALNLCALIYAWLIKCPYCGRYYARLTDKQIEKTLGSSAYTEITKQQTQVRIKREDGAYDTGENFSEAYNPTHNYERTFFMHDLTGEQDIEERQQDKVSTYFLMNHHTTCKYCGTSLKVRFRQTSEISNVGDERRRIYTEQL